MTKTLAANVNNGLPTNGANDVIVGFGEYGLPGLVIAALFAVLVFLIREHKAERGEWIQAYKDQGIKGDERQRETNMVIRELSAVIREANSRRRVND